MAFDDRTDGKVLRMRTIYHRPDDLPTVEFVVRGLSVCGGVITHDADFRTADTIEGARRLLPGHGLVPIPREAGDLPSVVETWL